MEQDHILIAKLNASSKVAFSNLFDKYVGMVHSFVSSLIKDDAASDDITQQVFIKLWEHRRNIAPEGNLPAWLYVSARNAVFKELKRMVLMDKYVNCALRSQQISENSVGGGIDAEIIRRELEAVVNSFPKAMKNIYLMRTVEGLSVAYIAAEMKLSPKTVETQLSRAKKKLKDKLEKI